MSQWVRDVCFALVGRGKKKTYILLYNKHIILYGSWMWAYDNII